MAVQKEIGILRKLDEIYQNSPTAQVLYNNAPLVLSLYKEIRTQAVIRQMEIERICAQRESDLARFKEIAPAMTKELSLIGQEIRNLQKTVRELAAQIGYSSNAQIQIDYANKQISDLIGMFNTLSINLLMS